MYFMSALLTLLAVLYALVGTVAAAPMYRRDVYVPPVLYPHQGTVWYVGQTHNVTWDNSHPPQQITNRVGRIMLRHNDRTMNLTLAEGFDITIGRIEVEVPAVPNGQYQVVLFGDSGNFSPLFTIKHGKRYPREDASPAAED